MKAIFKRSRPRSPTSSPLVEDRPMYAGRAHLFLPLTLHIILLWNLGITVAAAVALGEAPTDLLDSNLETSAADLWAFWIMWPSLIVIVTMVELILYWRRKLIPLYILASACIGTSGWILMFSFWLDCAHGAPNEYNNLNDYLSTVCPNTSQNYGNYFGLDDGVARFWNIAKYLFLTASVALLLHAMYLVFAVIYFRRNRQIAAMEHYSHVKTVSLHEMNNVEPPTQSVPAAPVPPFPTLQYRVIDTLPESALPDYEEDTPKRPLSEKTITPTVRTTLTSLTTSQSSSRTITRADMKTSQSSSQPPSYYRPSYETDRGSEKEGGWDEKV